MFPAAFFAASYFAGGYWPRTLQLPVGPVFEFAVVLPPLFAFGG